MREVFRKLTIGMIILLASYVGGWLMFVKPISDVLCAYNAGTASGILILVSILKCIFAPVVASVILGVGAVVANYIYCTED